MLYITILIPLLGGILLALLKPKTSKMIHIIVETAVCLTSIMVWILLLRERGTVYSLISFDDRLTLRFRIDGTGTVFAGLVSFLWPIASLYGFEYMHHEERSRTFFVWYTMTYSVVLALAFSANMFSMYCFYECLTMVTLPLVIHKQDPQSVRAGRMYLRYSVTGATFGFIALVFSLVYGKGDFTLGGILSAKLIRGNEDLIRTVFVLAFIGLGTKAAVYPMYAWLPAASVAPTPVTALLHAVAVVNAGAFAVLRVTNYVFGTELLAGSWAQYVVLAISCFTILFGSGMAVKEQHFKRRLAWSTISNLSYMLMGISLMTPNGMTGSLAHMICHGIMKITLFYCTGAILVQSGQEYVQDVRGFGRIMPVTCGVFVFASVALVGIPPLCGFVSKWNLLTAAAQSGTLMGTIAVATLIISAILTAIYLFSVALPFYFRPLNPEMESLAGKNIDPGIQMKLPLILLCVAMLVLGIWSAPVITFLRGVATGAIL